MQRDIQILVDIYAYGRLSGDGVDINAKKVGRQKDDTQHHSC